MVFSAGIMRLEKEKNNIIEHTCSTTCLSSTGGPLINLINYKVVGIHEGEKRNYNYCFGLFLKEPIEKFYDIQYSSHPYNYYPFAYRGLSTSREISLEEMEKLIYGMKKVICKIKCNNGSYGTGFFCNLQYGIKTTNIQVLMTTNNILNNNDISIGKKIEFSVNNDKINYVILIDKLRKTYTNEEYGIIIIEIKQDDNLEHISFFDIDEKIYEAYYEPCYKSSHTFLLHYADNIMQYSGGFIKDLDNYKIYHICDTYTNSSGGPLINAENFKVIGIHKGESPLPHRSENLKLGIFLRNQIDKFCEKYRIKNSNIKKNKIK